MYQLAYRICENSNTENCSIAPVYLTVVRDSPMLSGTVFPVRDSLSLMQNTGGIFAGYTDPTSLPILSNDAFNYPNIHPSYLSSGNIQVTKDNTTFTLTGIVGIIYPNGNPFTPNSTGSTPNIIAMLPANHALSGSYLDSNGNFVVASTDKV